MLLPENFSHLTPCVYFRELFRFIGKQIGFEVLVCLGPDIEPGQCTFLSILVSKFSFSSSIS